MDYNGQYLIVARNGVGGDTSDWCIVAGEKGIDNRTRYFKSKGLTHIYITKIVDSGDVDKFVNYSETNQLMECSIDELLDKYNDYLDLYNAFNDEEYLDKMEAIKLTIALKKNKPNPSSKVTSTIKPWWLDR